MCFRAFAVMFIAPFFSIIQNVFLSGKSGIGARVVQEKPNGDDVDRKTPFA